MTNVLILGYGNPLCGDDGVGWRVIEALAGLIPDDALATFHQLTPEWAEPISAAGHVVFVDAAVGDVPGEVRCFPIGPAPGRPGSHETTPDGILSMATDLFGRCPPAHMVTITGGTFDISESLTPAVAAAVPIAAARIHRLIEEETKRLGDFQSLSLLVSSSSCGSKTPGCPLRSRRCLFD